MKTHPVQMMSKALAFPVVPVDLVRTRRGWKAVMASAITPQGGTAALSSVDITPGHPMPKANLKLALSRRYCAEAFSHCDTVYIRPRYAMKCPWWGGRYGALPELASYMRRAGLI